MTYEESLEIIEKHTTAVIRGTSKNTLGEALEIATKALEKQIPRKLIEAYCPSCHAIAGRRWDYCWHCGQALDWSGEN